MENTFILLSYVVGTLFGLFVGAKVSTVKIVTATLDDLIARRYIRVRERDDGEIEFLEYDEEDV